MIKRIAEQVWRQVAGGNPTSESNYDIREIELYVRQLAAAIVKQDIYDAYRIESEWFIDGRNIAVFPKIAIRYDIERKVYYSVIPASYISLPSNRGVWSISPMGNEEISFIPVPMGGEHFINIRRRPFIQGQVGYKVEGDRIIYYNKNKFTNFVVVKLVTTDGNNEFNLSDDVQQRVIVEAVKFFTTRTLPDTAEDGNPSKQSINVA